ncbi:hypothetical protein NDI76_04005 [Halogeometricum sp. S1BR25-6]|uniref:Uncharacterized protein n=1 Tax=Halogeometricum salsisoli TaxID=2950536 RepID=A0ABU2GAQ9_9EURY|nr:hypothetical protein [Halogeometricum sp. S1BR25-6]MDS0297896.1 hypothetical protein [Halogeometricum sp. S1BR25-6]
MLRRRKFLQSGSLALAATAGCTVPDFGGGSGRGADTQAGVIWDRRYSGNRAVRFLDIVSVSTGGFLLVGFTTSNLQTPDCGFALRTDDEGTEQWRHTVSETTALLAAIEGTDEEFVAATYRATGSGGTGDSGAVALNDDGTERWRTSLSESGQSQLGTVAQVPDGRYALGGVDRSRGWLVRLESDGSIRTTRRPVLESVPLSNVIDLQGSASGLTVLASGGDAGTGDEWGVLFRLASAGSMAWGRRYDQQFSQAAVTDDGYALLGRENRPSFDPDVFLPPRPQIVVVDRGGSVTDSRAYGSSGEAHWFIEEALLPTPDGGFVIGGRYEPWEELGTRRGSLILRTHPSADSVAWARLHDEGERVWALARAGTHDVFTDTVDDQRRARLVRFDQPQRSNVDLQATTVSGPTSEPL